jgi:hypothetical protein
MIDACYFVDLYDGGYGDLFPTTDASMMFTCLYALTGVACLGTLLGILGSNLIDAPRALSDGGDLSRYRHQVCLTLLQVEKPTIPGTTKESTGAGVPRHGPERFSFSPCYSSSVCHARIGLFDCARNWTITKTIYYLNITVSTTTRKKFKVLHTIHSFQWMWWITLSHYYSFLIPTFYCVASTIGYGGITPQTQTGRRLIAIFFIPLRVVPWDNVLAGQPPITGLTTGQV